MVLAHKIHDFCVNSLNNEERVREREREREREICSACINLLAHAGDGRILSILCVIARSSQKKVVGDNGSSRGGGVKGWYAINMMICESSITKALIYEKPKPSCLPPLGKTITYNHQLPRRFMLQSL